MDDTGRNRNLYTKNHKPAKVFVHISQPKQQMRLPIHIDESSETNSENTSQHKQFTKSHKNNASNIVQKIKMEKIRRIWVRWELLCV